MSGAFASSRGLFSPSPLTGEPPSLTLPRKGGGDLLGI